MEELKLSGDYVPQLTQQSIKEFEEGYNIEFPDELIDFLLKYEGCQIDPNEGYFEIYSGIFYKLDRVLFLDNPNAISIKSVMEAHKKFGIDGYIPFALDPNDWDFNMSIQPDTYGQIWLNQFDIKDQNSTKFLANSLEEFVNKLQTNIS